MKRFTEENFLIRLGIVSFWTLFWVFNSIDKIVREDVFLWAGKDRFTQFVGYFSSIGIENEGVVFVFLLFVFIIEVMASILLGIALIELLQRNFDIARTFFFWGTLLGLAIFSFFTIGDQAFGERSELLEHTIYWIALIISWRVYVQPLGNKDKLAN